MSIGPFIPSFPVHKLSFISNNHQKLREGLSITNRLFNNLLQKDVQDNDLMINGLEEINVIFADLDDHLEIALAFLEIGVKRASFLLDLNMG